MNETVTTDTFTCVYHTTNNSLCVSVASHAALIQHWDTIRKEKLLVSQGCTSLFADWKQHQWQEQTNGWPVSFIGPGPSGHRFCCRLWMQQRAWGGHKPRFSLPAHHIVAFICEAHHSQPDELLWWATFEINHVEIRWIFTLILNFNFALNSSSCWTLI